jgi:hypothetical protein
VAHWDGVSATRWLHDQQSGPSAVIPVFPRIAGHERIPTPMPKLLDYRSAYVRIGSLSRFRRYRFDRCSLPLLHIFALAKTFESFNKLVPLPARAHDVPRTVLERGDTDSNRVWATLGLENRGEQDGEQKTRESSLGVSPFWWDCKRRKYISGQRWR